MKLRSRRAVLGALISLQFGAVHSFAAAAAEVQLETGWDWTATGPFGAKTTLLAASPHDDALLLVATAKGGLFRSFDGGSRWTRCESGASDAPAPSAVTCVAFDPENRAVVYAGTSSGEVFRSTDRSRTWSVIASSPDGDGIHAIAAHPRRHHLLLAATSREIVRSADGGETFSTARIVEREGLPEDASVRAFAFDPFHPAQVFAASLTYGVLRSEDGGESFASLEGAPRGVEGLAFDATNGLILYAYTSRGALKSLDRGATWNRLAIDGDPAPRFMAMAIDGTRPDRIALGDAAGRVFLSEDGGITWSAAGGRVLPAPVTGVGFLHGGDLLVATACGPMRIDAAGGISLRTAGLDDLTVRQILPCGTGYGRLLAGTDLGLYESSDYGFTWSLIDVPSASGRRGVNALAAHPTEAKVLFAGSDGGLLWTEDDGLTWRRQLESVTVSGIAPLPGEGARAWVTGALEDATVVFAGDASTATWSPVRFDGDAGLPWVRVHAGRPGTIFVGGTRIFMRDETAPSWREIGVPSHVRDLVLDPFDARHLYAATSTGLLESHDDGVQWDWTDVENVDVVRIVTSVSAPGLVAAITADGAFLQRSASSGWSMVPLPRTGETFAAALDASGETLYLGGAGGVIRSAIPPVQAPSVPPVRCTPNPFRGSTRIVADTRGERALGISIYSVGGGLIRTGRIDDSGPEISWEWDGRTDFGEEAASGLYLVLLHTATGDLAGKVVKLQ